MKNIKALAALTAVGMLTGMSGCGNVETNSSDESSEITSTEIESEAATETEAPTEGTTSCTHKWIDATCTTPKTCANCGETSGSALGHEWEDATCTSPKTCIRCGATEGTELGHTYSGMTCIRCGEDNPKFNPKTDIDTIEELEEYLNTAYSTIETSFGTIDSVGFNIELNDSITSRDIYPYDIYIQADADMMVYDLDGNYVMMLPYDLDITSISDSQRYDVIAEMQCYQMEIADIAMAIFPDKKISGGFYHS
ncbi:MAG: hypothetical protein LUG26_03890 [Ruminococcus sp.]|nr:hypothetical protein [Ruminococcus sp.]